MKQCIMEILLEREVMEHLLVSTQRPEETGTNLRIRKAGDVVSMFDNATINLNRSSLNPLDNHSYADIANVRNKAGNEPITRDRIYGSV